MKDEQISLLDAPRAEVFMPSSVTPLSEGQGDAPSSEPAAPYLFVKSVEIKPGDEMDTAIFGKVRIDRLFDREAEARAAGYVTDAHMKGGAWPFAGWKILVNVDRGGYAAVKLEAVIN